MNTYLVKMIVKLLCKCIFSHKNPRYDNGMFEFRFSTHVELLHPVGVFVVAAVMSSCVKAGPTASLFRSGLVSVTAPAEFRYISTHVQAIH